MSVKNDAHLTILFVRLFNASFRMHHGEAGQRARFHTILNSIGVRRRELANEQKASKTAIIRREARKHGIPVINVPLSKGD